VLLLLLVIIATMVQGHRGSTRWASSSLLSQSAATNANSNANIIVSSSKLSPLMRSVMKIRGGEDESEEEEEEESDDEEEIAVSSSSAGSGIDYAAILEQVVDVTKTKIVPTVLEYSKTGLLVAKKTSVGIYEALHRAIQAGLEGEELEKSDDEDDSDDEEVTTALDNILNMTQKSLRTVQRMVKAFITVPEEDGESSDDESEEEEIADREKDDDDDVTVEITEDETMKESETAPVPVANDDDDVENDFGSYLSEAYEIDDLRNSGKTKGPIILDGSLQDALQAARQQARMLLVFIPSEKPKGEQGGLSFFGGGKKGTAESEENNLVAIESLLSKEVAKASNKKARKKQAEDFGSFAIWGSKAGSSEAASAIKRLKVKETSTKGEKRSILCVVYPASSGGVIAPKVLAQHHCNPPLKAESMASWLNALRKRHGKQYEVMQTEFKEIQLYKERQEGYIDSVQSDNDRKIKEAQEEAERKAEEVKEAVRQAEIDARRQELQQSLPEDVKSGTNVKKIALRFPDGRTGQRGFESDQPLNVLFNWVDATFEIERETVVLTTLNGKQTFAWEGDDNTTTLEEAGLNKMTALRVSQATKEE